MTLSWHVSLFPSLSHEFENPDKCTSDAPQIRFCADHECHKVETRVVHAGRQRVARQYSTRQGETANVRVPRQDDGIHSGRHHVTPACNLLHDLPQEQAGETDFRWQRRYGGIVRFKSILGADQLLITDAKALRHILGAPDLYPFQPERRVMSGFINGKGIAWACEAKKDNTPSVCELHGNVRGRFTMVASLGTPLARLPEGLAEEPEKRVVWHRPRPPLPHADVGASTCNKRTTASSGLGPWWYCKEAVRIARKCINCIMPETQESGMIIAFDGRKRYN
ncbi:hypothetical protein EDD15DRAFT_2521832 [Pisolithus albus]|nr:hypothetical protein EDD15DRAFT_2521832 [Pisolithus albus]